MQKNGPNAGHMAAIVLLLVSLYCLTAVAADSVQSVKTDKEVYGAGESIRVNFSNSPGNNSDWICIVPAGSPDNEAGEYQYMPRGLSQGFLTFPPAAPGKYEVRAYYNYRRLGYAVSGRHAFSVVAGLPPMQPEIASSARSVPKSPERSKPVEAPAEVVSSAGFTQISGAVFHFTPISMDASNYGIIVTNTMINAPKIQSSFIILGRKDLEIFLAANNLQQNDRTENMIDIGSRLGLNFVIGGNIGKRGALIVTNCKVVSVGDRKVIFTHQLISAGESDLISNVVKMSETIAEAVLRGAK